MENRQTHWNRNSIVTARSNVKVYCSSFHLRSKRYLKLHVKGKNIHMKKNIVGKRVILRERRKEDAEFYAYWYSQPKIMFQCGFTEPTTVEQEEKIPDAEDSDWYTITDLNGKIIGETGLLRMWPVWHCTDLSIMIPNPEDQGKGYGTEVINMMCELAFGKYEMNRIAIGVVGKNVEALNFYKRVGFREEGIQEQGYYYNGEYSDFVMMRILRSEWLQRRE